MKKPTIRRIFAYILDAMIISIIASAIANIRIFNPYLDKYREVEKQYTEVLENSLSDQEKFQELMNSDKINDMSYNLTKYGVYLSISSVIVTFGYFVCFQYYTKGKTLGRLITRTELVSSNKEELTFIQLIKRSVIINSLITSPILIIMMFTLNKASYLSANKYVQLVDYTLLIGSICLMIYREDGKGIHDLFAGTRVISSDDREFYFKHEAIKEAEIVNEEEKTSEPITIENKKTTRKRSTKKKDE